MGKGHAINYVAANCPFPALQKATLWRHRRNFNAVPKVALRIRRILKLQKCLPFGPKISGNVLNTKIQYSTTLFFCLAVLNVNVMYVSPFRRSKQSSS